jgi:hypothetical protein
VTANFEVLRQNPKKETHGKRFAKIKEVRKAPLLFLPDRSQPHRNPTTISARNITDLKHTFAT